MSPDIFGGVGLGLAFSLGLRHGLDPDHVAVIDNITFRVADKPSRLAPWVGTLFALGHSLSVLAVAMGASLLSTWFQWPEGIGEAMDWIVIALLLCVAWLNLRGLQSQGPYTPSGWRQHILPKRWQAASSPLAIVAVGMAFGLVFDTATQAGAWGLAAGAVDGVRGAAIVAGVFAIGMIATDTLDSLIVAHLLRKGQDRAPVRRYRRGIGWLIVALSLGMAGYALLTKFRAVAALSDQAFTLCGAAMAFVVVMGLFLSRRAARV